MDYAKIASEDKTPIEASKTDDTARAGLALTITLKPQYRRYTCEEQHVMLNNLILDIRQMLEKRTRQTVKMTFTAEFQKSLDLHAHGAFVFMQRPDRLDLDHLLALKPILDSFARNRQSCMGFYMHKTIDSAIGWANYMFKETKSLETVKSLPSSVFIDELEWCPTQVVLALNNELYIKHYDKTESLNYMVKYSPIQIS